MKAYQRVCGKEVKQLVHNGARLCCVELARVTQPYGTGTDSKAKGEQAISNDLSKLFVSLDAELVEKFKDEKSLWKKGGVEWIPEGTTLAGSVADIKAIHSARRNKRSGRVFSINEKRRVVVDVANVVKFFKELSKKVGIAKAGWASVALLCKADVRAPLRGIPRWVTRNIISGAGSINDRKASGLGWKVLLENKIRYSRETLSKTNELIACNIAKAKMIKMMNAGIRYELKKAGAK